MIDVRRRRGPGVVEVADALLAEAAGYLFVRQKAPAQIFELDLFEPDFAGASYVQRHGAVLGELLVGLAVGASALRSIVDPHAKIIGIENDFQRIPLVRLVGISGTDVGRVRQAVPPVRSRVLRRPVRLLCLREAPGRPGRFPAVARGTEPCRPPD